MNDYTSPNTDTDPRLLEFAKHLRESSDIPVEIEDGALLIGDEPDCMVVEAGEADKIIISFNYHCHPQAVVTLFLAAFSSMDPNSLVISNCFVTDDEGTLMYEDEVGFELVMLQHYRETISSLQSKIPSA